MPDLNVAEWIAVWAFVSLIVSCMVGVCCKAGMSGYDAHGKRLDDPKRGRPTEIDEADRVRRAGL